MNFQPIEEHQLIRDTMRKVYGRNQWVAFPLGRARMRLDAAELIVRNAACTPASITWNATVARRV